MNSAQRRKYLRRTGKQVKINVTICPDGHKARLTDIGHFCPKCQLWGNTPFKTDNSNDQ